MQIRQTEIFSQWYNELKNIIVVAAIRKRIVRLESGNFGDCLKIKGVNGLFELRIHISKGYRLYYTVKNNNVVILISGGVKDNQSSDITKATSLLKRL